MYLEHFGLREAPFRITPHTEFFFAGGNRGATLDALAYAISQDEGIVKVSGEVGSGKTMLCRMLLQKLPASVETVFLANPSLTRDEILYAIANELHAPFPEGQTRLLLGALQERLLEIYASGRQVVVMIDEAHAMPAETLEEIRLLSNLESDRHKLMKIALFGQPELDVHLADPALRQLRERITHNFALEPLRRKDVGAYIMFRLRTAGYHGPDLFTPSAIQLISAASEGLTRRINILADKALLAAFADGAHQVDTRQAKTAIIDAQFGPMPKTPQTPATRAAIAAATAAGLVAVAALAYFAGSHANGDAPAASAAPAQASAPAPAAAAVAAPAAAPAVATNAERSETASPAADKAPPAAPAPVAAMAAAGAGSTLDERIAATREWLRTTPDQHYFIQLIAVNASETATAERQLASALRLLDATQVRAYRSALSGRERIGIIYGDYADQAAAEAALAQLPPPIRERHPYLRQVSRLR